MYLNKVVLVGNLTRDPELKTLPSGMKVSSFGLATNRVWKDAQGNKREAADFHNIVVFGRQAETVSQYMRKGSQILVEGRLQTQSWEDKDCGKKMYRTEIVADRIQFGNRAQGVASSAPVSEEAVAAPASELSTESIDYPEEEIDPEDIPF